MIQPISLTDQELAAIYRWVSTFSASLSVNTTLTEQQICVLDGLVHTITRVSPTANNMDRMFLQGIMSKIEMYYGAPGYSIAQQPPT